MELENGVAVLLPSRGRMEPGVGVTFRKDAKDWEQGEHGESLREAGVCRG